MPEKILINSGPSSAGWSMLSPFFMCERLFWFEAKRREAEAGGFLGPAFPLARGSFIHVGLAHHYARQGMAQAGLSSDIYYEPIEAMRLVAAAYPGKLTTGEKTSDVLDIAIEMVMSYRTRYTDERLQVVAVEAPAALPLPSLDGGPSTEVITQRIDLTIRDDVGKIYILDHKGSSELSKKTLIARYSLSGQFLLMQLLGSQLYGRDFGGCLVNVIGAQTDRTPAQRFYRFAPEPAPAMLCEFPYVVAEARARIKEKREFEKAWGEKKEIWRPAMHEQICGRQFNGRCEHFEACKWGDT